MLKNKKLLLGLVVFAALSAGTHATWAHSVPEGNATPVAVAPVMEEPVFNVLTDKVHIINARLNSAAAEHYYGFTALRGQDVILDLKSGQAIKVERHIDGAWTLITDKGINTLKNLKAGEEIIIRVTHHQATPFGAGQYSMVFGSYPILKKFDLQGEGNVLRIPYGYSEPAWLPGQAHKEASVMAQFTDSTGVPLEGGVVSYGLKLDGDDRENMTGTLISDNQGKASILLNIGTCQGGVQARDFVDYSQGYNNTWRTDYRVGHYVFQNFLAGSSVSAKYKFGHVCDQRLISSTRS